MNGDLSDSPEEVDDRVPLDRPELLSTQIDPLHRLGLALMLGTMLAAPSLLGAVKGSASLATAAWMFGVSVAVAWVMVWLVWAVWHMYRSQHDQVIWDAYAQAEGARLERVAALEAAHLAEIEAEIEAERLASEQADAPASDFDTEPAPSVDDAVDAQELTRRESQRLAGETERLQRELDDLVVDPRPGLIPPTARTSMPSGEPAFLRDAISEAPDSTRGLEVHDELTESR